MCKVRNLELDKSYQFRVRAENIYGISDPSPSSPPSRLMAPPKPVLDKNKKIIPLLDPYGYTEEALEKAYAEQYGTNQLSVIVSMSPFQHARLISRRASSRSATAPRTTRSR